MVAGTIGFQTSEKSAVDIVIFDADTFCEACLHGLGGYLRIAVDRYLPGCPERILSDDDLVSGLDQLTVLKVQPIFMILQKNRFHAAHSLFVADIPLLNDKQLRPFFSGAQRGKKSIFSAIFS